MLPRLIEQREVDVVVVGKRAISVDMLKAIEAMCREGDVELIWLRVDLQRLTSKSTAAKHAS